MNRERGCASTATPPTSAVSRVVTIVVRAFARIAEIVGAATLERDVPAGATAGDAWASLAREFPLLEPLGKSTRFARGGAFVGVETALHERDELALLPPFGGG